MKPAVGYLRKSSSEQDRQVKSLAAQRAAIEAYGEEHHFELVRWYEDCGTGTEFAGRSGFQRLLADARLGEFEYVIVLDPKRFARTDMDEAGYYTYLLRQKGVSVVYVTGEQDNDILLAVNRYLAQQESVHKSRYVLSNVLARCRQARDLRQTLSVGGPVPFGYDALYSSRDGVPHTIVRYLPTGEKQVFDANGVLQRTLSAKARYRKQDKSDLRSLTPGAPERVALVQRIYQLYDEHDLGQAAIAHRLNEELDAGVGVPPARGGRWNARTIAEMLEHIEYAGDRGYNRKSFSKFHRLKGDDNFLPLDVKASAPKVVRNPEEEWVVFADVHEPLIDRATFQRVQAKRARRKKGKGTSGRGVRSAYLFSGKLTCGMCGNPMTGTKDRKKGREYLGYCCSGYKKQGKAVCENHRLPERVLVEPFISALDEHLFEHDAEAVVEVANGLMTDGRKHAAAERRRIEGELRQVDADLDRLAQCINPDSAVTIGRQMKKLEGKRAALAEQLTDLRPRLASQPSPRVQKMMELARDLRRLFEAATPQEKKQFIDLLVEEVVVNPTDHTAALTLTTLGGEMRKAALERSSAAFLSGGSGGRI